MALVVACSSYDLANTVGEKVRRSQILERWNVSKHVKINSVILVA